MKELKDKQDTMSKLRLSTTGNHLHSNFMAEVMETLREKMN